MKFILQKSIFFCFSILLCLSFTNNSQAQYSNLWQNQYSHENWKLIGYGVSLSAVFFINDNTGWVAGGRARILKTTNGGDDWFFQYDTLNNGVLYFNCLNFINDQTGFAGGSNLNSGGMICRTTNSGLSWQFISMPHQVMSIYFIDSLNGYSACNNGCVMKTTNSGLNWTEYLIPFGYRLYDIKFINSLTGFVCGSDSVGIGIIYKTTNSGTTWLLNYSDSAGSYISMEFFSGGIGLAGSNNGRLLMTKDGGVEWRRNYGLAILGVNSICKIFFLNNCTGWITSRYSVCKTTNCGDDWRLQFTDYFGDVFFTNENKGFSVSDFSGKFITKTTNGGDIWNHILEGVSTRLKSLTFSTPDNGWIATQGKIITSTNGGLNWSIPQSYDSETYNRVYFVNPSTGWIVGGALSMTMSPFFYTFNGGSSWIKIWQGGRMFSDICHIGQTVFISGGKDYGLPEYGIILRGQSPWNYIEISLAPAGILWSVYFTGLYNGFVTGNDGYIGKSTDGGYTWLQQASPTSQMNTSVSFIDSLNGWIVGNNGDIIRTTNGGNNWNLYIHLNEVLYCVKFINSNTGWITGSNGTILATTNAGVNWVMQQRLTDITIRSVYFKNNNTGWLIGESGSIFYTENCGGLTGVNSHSKTQPVDYILYQNYPNPFNPSTKIKFDIPKSSIVRIIIYDILGKEITMLVNEKLSAGQYEVNWDGSNYPSGVYFYKLVTDEFSDVKRMLLIK